MDVFDSNRPLLDRFRRGERAALETVYYHYVDLVGRVVTHGFVVGSPQPIRIRGAACWETQRDLVQEVFTRAFSEKARLAYDGLRPYRPYLLRIARNLMIDRARRSGREQPMGDDHRQEPRGGSPDLADQLHRGELAAATRSFLDDLPPPIRSVVRLRFEDGCSQAAAAAALGISRRRVRTIESRVTRDLRRYLRSRGLLE